MTGKRFALLVATSDYQDPKFGRLRAPAHDVEALRGVLQDPAIGDFEVKTLLNAEHWVVTSEMEGFFADRKPDDFCLLYLSCHGVKDVTGRLHFAAATTRFGRLASTGISSTWVNEQLGRSRVRRAVVLLDCCYSGAFTKGLAPRGDEGVHVVESLEGRGRAVITASDAMEYAWEGNELTKDVAQPSLFTTALVDGLGTGAADRDGDGLVSVDDLYGYVHEQVRLKTPNQTPTMSVLEAQGDLVIAHNPHPPAPPVEPEPLPPDLVAAQYDQRDWVREAAVTRLRALLAEASPGQALSARMALEQHTQDAAEQVRAAARAALAATRAPAGEQAPEDAEPPPHRAQPVATTGDTDDTRPTDDTRRTDGTDDAGAADAPEASGTAPLAWWRTMPQAHVGAAALLVVGLLTVAVWQLTGAPEDDVPPDQTVATTGVGDVVDAPQDLPGETGTEDEVAEGDDPEAPLPSCEELTIAFVRDGDVWTRAPDGTEVNRTDDPAADNRQPRWSPDRDRLVFVRDLDETPALHLLDLASGAVSALTDDVGEGGDFDPTWHPDGDRIAFNRHGPDGRDLFVVHLTGPAAGEAAPLARTDGTDQRPAWSPQPVGGLVFHSVGGGSIDLYRAAEDGSDVRLLGSEPGWSWFHPSWSPDGTEVVFARTADGASSPEASTLHRISDGGEAAPLLAGRDVAGWDPAWCPLGQQLVYEAHDDEGTPQVFVIDLAADDPAPTALTTGGGSNPAW